MLFPSVLYFQNTFLQISVYCVKTRHIYIGREGGEQLLPTVFIVQVKLNIMKDLQLKHSKGFLSDIIKSLKYDGSFTKPELGSC